MLYFVLGKKGLTADFEKSPGLQASGAGKQQRFCFLGSILAGGSQALVDGKNELRLFSTSYNVPSGFSCSAMLWLKWSNGEDFLRSTSGTFKAQASEVDYPLVSPSMSRG